MHKNVITCNALSGISARSLAPPYQFFSLCMCVTKSKPEYLAGDTWRESTRKKKHFVRGLQQALQGLRCWTAVQDSINGTVYRYSRSDSRGLSKRNHILCPFLADTESCNRKRHPIRIAWSCVTLSTEPQQTEILATS